MSAKLHRPLSIHLYSLCTERGRMLMASTSAFRHLHVARRRHNSSSARERSCTLIPPRLSWESSIFFRYLGPLKSCIAILRSTLVMFYLYMYAIVCKLCYRWHHLSGHLFGLNFDEKNSYSARGLLIDLAVDVLYTTQ